MKEQLTHILDQSVCLSRKQMKEYLSGSMLPEETHAAELHISSCPLCSMAMEGFQEHSDAALSAIASLNSGFLKEHFDNIAPQIHLNSMAPSAALNAAGRRKAAPGAWVRPVGIAAGLLLICAAAWYLASRSGDTLRDPDFVQTTVTQSAEQTTSPEQAPVAAQLPAPQPVAIPAPAQTAMSQQPAPATLKPAKTTQAADRAVAVNRTEGHGSPNRYWQPEPIPVEDPVAVEKAAATPLPSANDVSKTYQGDIKMSTKKIYVPPTENDAAPRVAASSGKPATTKPAAEAAPHAEPKPVAKRSEESSDQLFERGEYRSALSKYRQQIRSTDAETRSHASLQAARCYAALGEPDRAETLLRKVIEEGNGRERRTARKLLRNLR